MDRPDFQRLCDAAEVRGLRVGLVAGPKVRRPGVEQFRDLQAIVVSDDQHAAAYPGARIHSSIDAAARRLLEAIQA